MATAPVLGIGRHHRDAMGIGMGEGASAMQVCAP